MRLCCLCKWNYKHNSSLEEACSSHLIELNIVFLKCIAFGGSARVWESAASGAMSCVSLNNKEFVWNQKSPLKNLLGFLKIPLWLWCACACVGMRNFRFTVWDCNEGLLCKCWTKAPCLGGPFFHVTEWFYSNCVWIVEQNDPLLAKQAKSTCHGVLIC